MTAQLELFGGRRPAWRRQSVDELEQLAEQLAARAQREHADGWRDRATTTAWHALILFASVDEIRRRQRKDEEAKRWS